MIQYKTKLMMLHKATGEVKQPFNLLVAHSSRGPTRHNQRRPVDRWTSSLWLRVLVWTVSQLSQIVRASDVDVFFRTLSSDVFSADVFNFHSMFKRYLEGV